MLSLSYFSGYKLFECCKNVCTDSTDRAHFIFTSVLLTLFAILIGGSQNYGTPLQCMVGAHFPRDWIEYVNSYCFVTRTFVPKNLDIDVMPDVSLPNNQRIDVTYYQWIPYLLIIQAIFFILPQLFWNTVLIYSDIDFKFFIERCVEARTYPIEKVNDELKRLVHDICQIIKYRKIKQKSINGLGCTGALLYCLSKVLNIANVLFQINFLNHFIGHDRPEWGLDLIQHLLSSNKGFFEQYNQTASSIYFPRVSFCSFRQNVLGQLNEHSVQCLLMLNMLNEKIFVFIYVWLYILLAATCTNLIFTVMRLFSTVGTAQSLSYLKVHDIDRRLSIDFVGQRLGRDGLLLLHFIKYHAGFHITSELTRILYKSEINYVPKLANGVGVKTLSCVKENENGSFLKKNPMVETEFDMSYA